MNGKNVNDLPVLVALGYLSAVGALYFNIQPVWLGALSHTFDFNNQQLGATASAGLFAEFAVLVSAFFWVRRVSARVAVGAGAMIVLMGLVSLLLATDYISILCGVILLGAGMAAIYAPVLVLLGTSINPERAFGLSITIMVLLASLSVYLIPVVLLPQLGFHGVVVYLILVMVLVLAVFPWIPNEKPAPQGSVPTANGWISACLSLLAMTIFFLGLNGVWAFLERIGTDKGLSVDEIGFAFSLSMLLGVMGSTVAPIVSKWLHTSIALLLSATLFAVFLVIIRWEPSGSTYFGALIIFNIAWNFSLTFQMAIIARIDTSGRYLALIPAAQTLGGAAGTVIAGPLLMKVGPDALYLQLLICVIAACLTFSILDWKRKAGIQKSCEAAG